MSNTEIDNLAKIYSSSGVTTQTPAPLVQQRIIAILKAVAAGRTVKDVCREHEISEATYYQWKSQYGGMQASDIKRLRELEEEHGRLKQISADLLLENRALKHVDRKQAVTPAVKREL